MWNILRALLSGLLCFLRSAKRNALTVAALEQQLGVYRRERPKPPLTNCDRAFWIALVRHFSRWRETLVIVKPATVIGWHRKGYRFYWRWCTRFGRPRIPRDHVDLIRAISREHPELGEDQLALELEKKLGVRHAPSTIRRYRWKAPRPEPSGRHSQSWQTLIRNHANAIWACDFVVQPMACFVSAYIFVIVEIGSRRVVWINATTSPSLGWVETQIRQACPFDEAPEFLIHDNDGIFGQYRKRAERRPFRCAEHVLDHLVFLNTRHLVRVLRKYVEYYNRARPSQATRKIPDPYPELRAPPPADGKVVALPVLGGLHHDYRRAA